MKKITNKTVLVQGDKTSQPVEVDNVIYWIDKKSEKQGWCIYASNKFYYLYGSGIWDRPRWSEGAKLLCSTSNYIAYTKIIAQSQPKLEGIPVITLDSYANFKSIETFPYTGEGSLEDDIDSTKRRIWVHGYKSNSNPYTQKDIEKAIELARKGDQNWEGYVNPELTVREIFEQINSISVIKVDKQFNILNYE